MSGKFNDENIFDYRGYNVSDTHTLGVMNWEEKKKKKKKEEDDDDDDDDDEQEEEEGKGRKNDENH